MMHKPGGSTSLWMDTADMGEYPPLSGDLLVDVCIVGGGIAGLSTACFLAAEGRRVALLEARQLGSGETGRTTAHFFPPDERYYEIERRFGKKGAALVADAYTAATERVQRMVSEENIACEWERLPGYLFAPSSAGWSDIEKEYRAARRAGVRVRLVERVPGLSFDTGPALQFFDQAQFHPLKYLRGLARTLQQGGGSLYCDTRVTGIARAGAERIVQCAGGQVRCQAVVVATNTPFHERITMHTKQAAYRTYVLGLKLPKGSMPHMLLWDTGQPYYYIRLEAQADSGQDILIVGGVDHKVGTDEHPEHRYEEIQRWVSTRFPQCTEVAWRWSGEVMEPVDGLPFLGRDPNDSQVFMITGDSGNGMTHCTAGAMLVTDLIQGRTNPWADLYDPARKVQNGLGRFVREQADVLTRFADRLRGGEVEDSAEIAPGEGAVLRVDGERLAAYRDEEGGLHVLSATCTHLGCSVAWNAAEKSWDCPCHGSRFDVEGEVLHGPARSALPARELEMHPPGAMPSSGRRPGRRL